MQPIFEMWRHFVAFFAVMAAFFTIICGIAFYYHNIIIFTGTIQGYVGGISFSFKPSAFESELHPLHKLCLCNGDFALAGSTSHAGVT